MAPESSPTIEVSNLGPNSTEAELESLFQDFGKILNISVDSDKSKAKVAFGSQSSATEAKLCYDGVVFGKNPMKVKILKVRVFITKESIQKNIYAKNNNFLL